MKWFEGTIAEAIATSRRQKAFFVVVLLHDKEERNELSLKMERFWETVDENRFDPPIVGICIFAGTKPAQQFSQIYPTPVVPASYIIDLVGRPVDVITVNDNMDDVVFMSRLNAATKGASDAGSSSTSTSHASAGMSHSADGTNSFTAYDTQSPPMSQNVIMDTCTDPTENQLTLENRVECARHLLEEKRKADERRKVEEERVKELERRNLGKQVAEAKMSREDKELREEAEKRRKDKIESQRQLKLLREQLKADREERRQRLNMSGDICSSHPLPDESNRQLSNVPLHSDQSEECRIQCKFADGSNLVQTFPSSSKFSELIDVIAKDGRASKDFYLVQTYPRREFPDASQTFQQLELTPTATLLVISKRSSHSVIPANGSAFFELIQNAIVAPLRVLYRIITTFFGYGGTNSPKTGMRYEKARRVSQTRDPTVSRQEGNIHRFHNDDANHSDDEARYNGNSTQQL